MILRRIFFLISGEFLTTFCKYWLISVNFIFRNDPFFDLHFTNSNKKLFSESLIQNLKRLSKNAKVCWYFHVFSFFTCIPILNLIVVGQHWSFLLKAQKKFPLILKSSIVCGCQKNLAAQKLILQNFYDKLRHASKRQNFPVPTITSS